jgi:DNA repair protein RecO (recombination protein O)
MARERTFRTEAIILRRSDFGEADRLLTLYSRELGKMKAIAKGARKPQSRKTGHVELFMRSNFLIAKGRDLDIITQAEIVEAYAPLRADLVLSTYASYAVELLDRFTVEEDRHNGIYDLLADTLSRLAGTADLRLVARYYELHLLSFTGFRPRLFQCVSCAAPIVEQDQFFSLELGGLLCPECRQADVGALPISAAAVKVLRYLQTRSWDAVQQLQLRAALWQELEQLMLAYIVHTLERNLKSVDFLYRLRREAATYGDQDGLTHGRSDPAVFS